MMREMFNIIYFIFSFVVLVIEILVGGFFLRLLGICPIYALVAVYITFVFLILFFFEEEDLEDLRGCFYVGAFIVGLVIILAVIGAGLNVLPAIFSFLGLFIFAALVEETRNLP